MKTRPVAATPEEVTNLEKFIYSPGGAFNLFQAALSEGEVQGTSSIRQLSRESAAGAVRLSGQLDHGVVVELGKSEAAIANDNWSIRALVPSSAPFSIDHQLQYFHPSSGLTLCPVRTQMVAGELHITAAPHSERSVFYDGYRQAISEALIRLGFK